MRQLPPAPAPLDTNAGEYWVVFEVRTQNAKRLLMEVGRTRAGTADAAIVSVAESGFQRPGRLVALPEAQLRGGRVQPYYFVDFSD